VKIIYVAGPFFGQNAWEIEQNIRRAESLGLDVARAGAMPVIPHTNNRFFFGTLPEEFWRAGVMELLRRCDAVIFVPGWERSSGAVAERAEAERLGLPCFDSVAQLTSWLREHSTEAVFIGRVPA
jgi:nucleoside 2-deoxyribosyltransferase